jgi:DNA excision repair protein ERCC-8
MAELAERQRAQAQLPLFHLLAEREFGIWRPMALDRVVKAARARDVRLSECRDIDPPTPGAEISCLAVDEVEERYLLCGYSDGSLAVIDVEDRPAAARSKFEAVIKIDRTRAPHGHSFGVTGAVWYPKDTGLFITSSFDKTVKVWDTNLEQVALNFDTGQHVYGVAVQAMARTHNLLAVAGGDHRAMLYDMATGGQKHVLLGHRGPVYAVAWSTCEEHVLATGGADGTLRLWDIRRTQTCRAILNQDGPPTLLQGSGQERKRMRAEVGTEGVPYAHPGGVSGLLFSPYGRHLLSSGADGRMRSWHPITCNLDIVNYGAFPQTSAHNYKRVQFAVSWNANLVYHPRRNDVIVCDIETGQRLTCLSGHMATVYCCAAQPRTDVFFSGGRDSNILVWHPPMSRAPDSDEDADPALDAWSDHDEDQGF